MKNIFFGTLILIGLMTGNVIGQGASCSAIARNALNKVDTVCNDSGRNELCYANKQIDIQFIDEDTNDPFENEGDIIAINLIQQLRLYPMNTEERIWGVASMNLQASLADTTPGQTVNVVMFGDVELQSNQASIQYDIASTGNINVRSGPSTNYAVVGSLTTGQTVKANGRNEAGDWVRINRENDTQGWVWVDLMSFEDDLMTLDVVSDVDEVNAFYVKTGIGDAPCITAPNSGILFQTPEGAGEVAFLLNEVDFRVGSTIFVQAEADGDMTVNVIEGKVTLSAFDEEQTALTNMRIRVPLDENLAAAGPPRPPEPCNIEDLQALDEPAGSCNEIKINLDSTECPLVIPAGMNLNISNNYGAYQDFAVAQAEHDLEPASITINGERVDAEQSVLYDFADPSNPEFYDPDLNGWGFHVTYVWEDAQAGSYEIFGPGPAGSAFPGGRPRSCQVEIVEAQE